MFTHCTKISHHVVKNFFLENVSVCPAQMSLTDENQQFGQDPCFAQVWLSQPLEVRDVSANPRYFPASISSGRSTISFRARSRVHSPRKNRQR